MTFSPCNLIFTSRSSFSLYLPSGAVSPSIIILILVLVSLLVLASLSPPNPTHSLTTTIIASATTCNRGSSPLSRRVLYQAARVLNHLIGRVNHIIVCVTKSSSGKYTARSYPPQAEHATKKGVLYNNVQIVYSTHSTRPVVEVSSSSKIKPLCLLRQEIISYSNLPAYLLIRWS